VSAITIPPELRQAVDEDDIAERFAWLDGLPAIVELLALEWRLELGGPYLPGGQCAWVAPARNAFGDELALKVGWRHREAEHEADALRLWDDARARTTAPAVREL
jgi:streptomycin 6-kinase